MMSEKEAWKKLEKLAAEYGLTLKGSEIYDVEENDSYFSYTVATRSDADYVKRWAKVRIVVLIRVKRMGGDGLRFDELDRIGKRAHDAAQFAEALEKSPIMYEEKW